MSNRVDTRILGLGRAPADREGCDSYDCHKPAMVRCSWEHRGHPVVGVYCTGCAEDLSSEGDSLDTLRYAIAEIA